MAPPFVDIHCHLLPGIDDGPRDWEESLAMARIAVDDGITTVIVTPHQLGGYRQVHGDEIRRRTAELKERLKIAGLPLTVLAGADVRIDEGLVEQIAQGSVLTLGDHLRHLLIELPHELYLPLDTLVSRLARNGVAPILSHPERNAGILRQPRVLDPVVDAGCLLQVTAGSLCGSFGLACQDLAEQLLAAGIVHFVATDAHGSRSRRPLMQRAFDRVAEIVGEQAAIELCCHNPHLVALGQTVPAGRRPVATKRRSSRLPSTAA
jgi:protein-tyrosine phosphatase